NTGHGMYISGTCDGVVVRGNTIFANANLGIHINGDKSEGGAGVVTHALIANNVIYNNGTTDVGNGINADGLQNSVIENNLIYNLNAGNGSTGPKHGIVLYQIDAG